MSYVHILVEHPTLKRKRLWLVFDLRVSLNNIVAHLKVIRGKERKGKKTLFIFHSPPEGDKREVVLERERNYLGTPSYNSSRY